jgi:hypothetical protein
LAGRSDINGATILSAVTAVAALLLQCCCLSTHAMSDLGHPLPISVLFHPFVTAQHEGKTNTSQEIEQISGCNLSVINQINGIEKEIH